jgi:SAM domain (Sterile alpha motif)
MSRGRERPVQHSHNNWTGYAREIHSACAILRSETIDVGEFLRELGLQQYEATFRANRINIRVLPQLTIP